MPSKFDVIKSEQLSAYFRTEVWQVIKYRLLHTLNTQIQKKINSAVSSADSNRAALELGRLQGIELAIQVSENLPKEILDGKFSADEALTVIGKNIEQNKKETSWLSKVLENLRLKK